MLNDLQLLRELIDVRLENMNLKRELAKEKHEAVVMGVKDILVMSGLLIWIVILLW